MKSTLLSLLLLGAALPLAAAAKLTGDTSNPNESMYIIGQKVTLNFRVSGLKNGEKLSLTVNIVDPHEKTVQKQTLSVQGDAKGNWSGSCTGPSDRFGFYRVRAKLSNGAELPKVGSRPAGCLTYAVVMDPMKRPLLPLEDTFFGLMNSGMAHIIHPWIGARWYLGEYGGTDPVKYEADKKKRHPFRFYRYALIKEEPYRSFTPEQLKKHTDQNKVNIMTSFIDAEGEALYKEACRKIARNYALRKKEIGQMRYQILWEPNLGCSDEGILKMHKAAREAIREVDPTALILGPCFSSSAELARQESLFKRGLLDNIDEFTIHPYCYYPVENNNFVENIRTLIKLIRKYDKGRNIPIRGTEAGVSVVNTKDEELMQMDGHVRAALILLGEGFASHEPFHGYDFENRCTGDWGMAYNLSAPQRIWSPLRTSPRPVIPAMAACSMICEGHRPTATLDYLGDTVLGYAYADKKDHCVIALWDFGGNHPVVEIPVGKAQIELADIMGNSKTVKTNGGLLKLTLSSSPQYLIGVDPKLWGRHAVKQITTKESSVTAVVGSSVTLRGKLHTPGTVQLVFPARMEMKNLSVKAGKEFALSFTIPETLKNGKYPLVLKLSDSRNSVIGAVGVLLEVKAPLETGTLRPAFRGNTPGIRVPLSNLTGKTLSGTLETRIKGTPEARKRVSFTLAPNGKKDLYVPFEDMEISPFEVVNVRAVIRLENGYLYESGEKLNFLQASYVPKAGAGGDFSAWKNPNYYPLNAKAIRSPFYHSGAADLSAKAAVGWNESFLLFDVEVTDDKFLQPYTGWWTWYGDCLQFGLAARNRVPRTANQFADEVFRAYSEISFALTEKGMEAERTISYDKAVFPLGTVQADQLPRNITMTTKNGKAVIRYQIAVPWSFLNLKSVKKGDPVWWAITVNDRDETSKKQADVSAIGAFELKQRAPADFGMILLN